MYKYRFNVCGWTVFSAMMLLWSQIAFTGCQSSGSDTSDIKLEWHIQPDPPQVGPATIDLALRDSTNQPIEGAEVTLEGNMSHPGMQPVMATAEETGPGRYQAQLNFTMGGDWFILVNATLPDQREVERQIDIAGVRSQ